jgi:hypothetical protein
MRYNLSYQLFKNGKLTLLELNAAMMESANFRRDFIGLIKAYYLLYFQMKKTCVCKLD